MSGAERLFADFVVLDEEATLTLESPSDWAGAIWRLGPDAYRLYLAGKHSFTAAEAKAAGLCDEIGSGGRGMEQRSALAGETAAELIVRRGGDALERAAFALLFAAGEPQEGLTAFLEKRRPRFPAK